MLINQNYKSLLSIHSRGSKLIEFIDTTQEERQYILLELIMNHGFETDVDIQKEYPHILLSQEKVSVKGCDYQVTNALVNKKLKHQEIKELITKILAEK